MSNINTEDNHRFMVDSHDRLIASIERQDVRRERLSEIALNDRAEAEYKRLALQQQSFRSTLAMFKGA